MLIGGGGGLLSSNWLRSGKHGSSTSRGLTESSDCLHLDYTVQFFSMSPHRCCISAGGMDAGLYLQHGLLNELQRIFGRFLSVVFHLMCLTSPMCLDSLKLQAEKIVWLLMLVWVVTLVESVRWVKDGQFVNENSFFSATEKAVWFPCQL